MHGGYLRRPFSDRRSVTFKERISAPYHKMIIILYVQCLIRSGIISAGCEVSLSSPPSLHSQEFNGILYCYDRIYVSVAKGLVGTCV